MSEPVIVAASDNKNISAPTASCGCPTPTEPRQCASSAPALAARYCGVSITPGAMRLNRTRCRAISLAALLANAISVSRGARPALVREPRRKCDDRSASARDHTGYHRLIAPHHAVEIDPQHALPCRGLHFMDERAGLNRRRANEAIDLAELALDTTENGEHLGTIGDVEASRRNSGNIR